MGQWVVLYNQQKIFCDYITNTSKFDERFARLEPCHVPCSDAQGLPTDDPYQQGEDDFEQDDDEDQEKKKSNP